MAKKEKTIECPKCWVEAKKEKMEAFGPDVIIDVCPKCRGIWLDQGELKKITGNRKLSDFLTKEIGTQSKSELVCPGCGGLMDIERADDVEVDVCLECNGVWLDAGELDELKEKKEFKGDELEKEEERWEERTYRERTSRQRRFFRFFR